MAKNRFFARAKAGVAGRPRIKDFQNFSLGGPERYFLPWIRAT